MGFREELNTALLKFEGEYEGAEVRCRLTVPTEMFLMLQRLVASKDADQINEAFSMFGDDVLIDWNVEDPVTGEPYPATGAGFKHVSPKFAGQIIRVWMEEVAGVSAPLAAPSGNGAMSEAELEMTALP